MPPPESQAVLGPAGKPVAYWQIAAILTGAWEEAIPTRHWGKKHFITFISDSINNSFSSLVTNLGLVLMGSAALTFVAVAAACGRGDFGVPGVLGVVRG